MHLKKEEGSRSCHRPHNVIIIELLIHLPKSGGTVSVGAPEWGSTEMDLSGTATSGYRGARGPGAGATGGVDGPEMNGGGMRVMAPKLPLLRLDRQNAGVVTPPWMDADRHGGSRAPEARLPGKETRSASHVFAEPRGKDFIPERRDDPWSPENVLIDTVGRMQPDLNDMRAESRYLRTPGVRDALPPSSHVTFASTKVPRFAGTTSWEQYRQVFDAIVLSNGWDDTTAALQLLSHLEGDALNVALLVPAPRRASRVRLVDALTAHYGSPGRLRKFEKTTWTAGEDLSILAISLETLAVKAFGDMGQTAQLRLIRDRFTDIIVVSCADIWTVCRRKPPYGILWIGAGCGRVMRTRPFGVSVNRDPTRHSRLM